MVQRAALTGVPGAAVDYAMGLNGQDVAQPRVKSQYGLHRSLESAGLILVGRVAVAPDRPGGEGQRPDRP